MRGGTFLERLNLKGNSFMTSEKQWFFYLNNVSNYFRKYHSLETKSHFMRGLNIYLSLNGKAEQEKLDLLRCGNSDELPRSWGREPHCEGWPSKKATQGSLYPRRMPSSLYMKLGAS